MPRRVHKPVLFRFRSSRLLGVGAFLIASLVVTLFGARVTTSQSQQGGAPGNSNPPQVSTTNSSSRSLRKDTPPRGRIAKAATKPGPAGPNLANERTLYVVGYAHLDTEWRWEYPQTIGEYLPKTLRNNFALFEKYPHYIFNFTGSNRYRMMKEYNPADFARLKQYVAAGRWYPAGSSVEEGDVNSPNAESIIRQILYGNNWFRKEFGMASEEYMLPDCFGFPASLPSLLAHAGIKGFSTQKLSSAWQPAPHVGGPDSPQQTPVGIPFNVGIWEGPDGRTVIAALNPLSYGSQVTYDISKSPQPPPSDPNLTPQQNQRARAREDWVKRIDINGNLTGVFADYHYVGTGDVGGSPNESSVRLMEAITTRGKAALPQSGPPSSAQTGPAPLVQVGDGPIKVVWSKADQLFLDILRCCKTDALPRYKGDLELINHSAGSLTSQAYQKRWSRKNELLADAAEKASVAAEWFGSRAYPRERLNNAWTLVMGGQFHDLLPGTATPKAFQFAWNDEVLAMNQFASVLTSATESVASGLDTRAKGTPIVVYNPLNVQREDVVEAAINFPNGMPQAVRVFAPDGREVPAQLSNGKVLFTAKVPSVGYAVYDVIGTDVPSASSDLKVTESSLENARYRIQLDKNGDVSSLFDKRSNRELLDAPIRLAVSTDNPRQWPAWNMDFEDQQRPPRSFVGGPAKIRIVENGPVRVSVEVTREGEDSKFVQTISLSTWDNYDLSVASRDGRPGDGSFDWFPNNQNASQGKALPAEMLPREIIYGGIRFGLAPAGKPNAVVSSGQTITLPAGKYNRVYLLAAATGDQKATFTVGDKPIELTIQDWSGFIGQWDDRKWVQKEVQIPGRTPPPGTPPDIAAQMQRTRTRIDPYAEVSSITPGFIKRAPVAWFASHRHGADGANEPYAYSYLFAYTIDLPAGARTLTLPNNERIRILAVTVANEVSEVRPAQPLYDTLEH